MARDKSITNPGATAEPKAAEGQTQGAKKGEADVAQPEAEMVHLIVFKLGTEEYAIKIDQVKEVTTTPSVTRMPRTPDFVKGVANIRGDIIAIIDMEKRFQIRPAELIDGLISNQSYTLVIEAKDYSIGVEVKEVPQSLNLPVTKIDKAPSFLQDVSVSENFIEGLAKINNRLIIVLDMHKILTQDEINQLSKS
ncbi:chemotaxis protein CheW [Pontibacter oryzae]|uniref:Purine-binding chemotaxis protein CheW n=1 Tax=Pontibacter oryzae TaxID=2304593 RepID=A0A399SIH4_9BACT|nr:chemotaxis protein CheW [Pontibacter oryzae]RIJ41922.1 purine-binding chemotaxis protein CheW [Pontibacter oryzae]